MIKEAAWHVLMPVRGTTASKTRLFPDDAHGARRRELALAFACDAVTAALASSVVAEVSVITGDPEAQVLFAGLGASVIAETGGSGLNSAIRQGLRQIRAAHPLRWRAVLMADLPALASADVTAALRLAGRYRTAVVPDAASSGTTMLTAGPGTEPEPQFGPSSHAGHRAAGLRTLDLSPASTLRRDVDTLADLAVAMELGLGRHTRTALRAWRMLPAA
ncbi:2-phospho-L-lactate guanylyltransferase [Arthrobacter ginsengisoli]|uniref:Phosphoenolpyruvate guanylyltransferase n=1 Tax=Arthrobacter ginsengisoli TaxID=1356565 RepID=A0ABU1UI94_9MICC|nr:2-phospho-L-lactate guanylyltransferase [Arthrobacter ginsengisoli]MDR7084921.1 2-phospho-L-lactate guanylyltransferase [Arthrobacter ginsengisoli]